MSQHTPVFDTVTAYGAAGGHSGNASVSVKIEGKASTVESVRSLIAAAPELLAALEYVLPSIAVPKAFERARTAIAKAKGE